MLVAYDPDKYVVELKQTKCAYHQLHPETNYPDCTCSSEWATRLANNEEYVRNRRERLRAELRRLDAERAKVQAQLGGDITVTTATAEGRALPISTS